MEEEINFPQPATAQEGTVPSPCAATLENKQLRKWMIQNMITENTMDELIRILKSGFNVENVAKNAKKLVTIDKHLFQEIVCNFLSEMSICNFCSQLCKQQ